MEDYQHPIVTVDVALFTLTGGALHVALLARDKSPFEGVLALPGGYVHTDEDDDLARTARRVIEAKCGVRVPYLEQLYTFSGKKRDPRGWSASIAYYVVMPAGMLASGNGDLRLFPVDALPKLAFDHAKIVSTAVQRLRAKSTYSSLPAFLLPEEFTLPELQRVYEQVQGTSIDRWKFRRRFDDLDIIEPTSGTRVAPKGAGRPGQLFKLRARVLSELKETI